jgi:tripartite-type tricarboxylate transporter receptor subunit TctC
MALQSSKMPSGPFSAERLGEPFVIENRPGAGGNIAGGSHASACRRLHTSFDWASGVISPSLCDKLDFNRFS